MISRHILCIQIHDMHDVDHYGMNMFVLKLLYKVDASAHNII